jgi:hypothetical protein
MYVGRAYVLICRMCFRQWPGLLDLADVARLHAPPDPYCLVDYRLAFDQILGGAAARYYFRVVH